MSYAQGAGDWRIHPDEAKYKIYGNFETKFPGDGVSYELTEVNPVGFVFPIQPTYYGGQTTQGNVYFTFDHVTYNGDPDLEHIALWVYDETLNKWVPDEETGKEKANASNTNEMTVMLVLDCSSSLSPSGFADVQKSAKSFIDVMLASSNSGNIHIGIIGFSSMKQTRTLDLQPLTSSSAIRMKSFIDGFSQGNGTALYWSYDEAYDLTWDYAQKLKKYAGSAIVTFTDGLDNGSINQRKKIGSKENYFKHIKEEVLNKSIRGIPYQSYTIFVEGGADVRDRAIKNKAMDELKILAKQDDRFYLVNSTSELDNRFRQIAKSLIDSWKVLSCYISAGQNGRVCWTFGQRGYKPVVEKKEKVKTKRKAFYGINFTLGVPMVFAEDYYSGNGTSYSSSFYQPSYSDSESYLGVGGNVKLGLDMAWPVSDKFAVGTYMNIGGGGTSVGGSFDFKVGLLMLFGNQNDRPFIFGLAPCTGIGWTGCYSEYYWNNYYGSYIVDSEWNNLYLPIELRLGRVLKKHFYITGNLNLGIPLDGGMTVEPGISIGYRFGK